jgi:soluble lytic murein transglycosylase-like protein
MVPANVMAEKDRRGTLNALTGPFGAGRRRSDRRDPSHPASYSGPDRRRGERRRRTTRGLLFAAFTLAGAGTPWTLQNTVTPTVQVSEESFRAAAEPPKPEGRFDRLISEAATTYGVDVDLVRAVIKAESNFNPRARSPVGAEGLMQLMPALQKDYGVTDPFDPRQNVMGGVRYLAKLLDMHGNNVALALASYNAGPGNVARYGGVPPFRETRNYVKKIQGFYDAMTGENTNE